MYTSLVLISILVCAQALLPPSWDDQIHNTSLNIPTRWAYLNSVLRRDSSSQGPTWNMFPKFGPWAGLEALWFTCGYNAWVSYSYPRASPTVKMDVDYRNPYSSRFFSNRDESFSYAVFRCMEHTFKEFPPFFTDIPKDFFEELGYDPEDRRTEGNCAPCLGNYAAQKTIEDYLDTEKVTNGDGSQPNGNGIPFSDHTTLEAVNDPMPLPGQTNCSLLRNIDHWQPARVANGNIRFWGDAGWSPYRGFGIESGISVLPEPPCMNGSDATRQCWNDDFNELVTLSGKLNDTTKMIAYYWQDLEDGRIWFPDAAVLADLSFADTVKLFLVGFNARADAIAAQYSGKYFYRTARPTTAIQCINTGKQIKAWKGPYQGAGFIDGSEWKAYVSEFLVNNPTPEYPCGHCTQASTMSDILRRFFRSDKFVGYDFVIPEGKSALEPKITDPNDPRFIDGVTNVPNSGPETVGYVPAADIYLTWKTWSGISDEVNVARQWLGVHTFNSNRVAKDLGLEVSKRAWKKAQDLFRFRVQHFWEDSDST